MTSVLPALTRDQAQQDANRIMDYWAARGYEVSAWPVPARLPKDAEVMVSGWGVRSNLVNGCPPEMLRLKQRALLG